MSKYIPIEQLPEGHPLRRKNGPPPQKYKKAPKPKAKNAKGRGKSKLSGKQKKLLFVVLFLLTLGIFLWRAGYFSD